MACFTPKMAPLRPKNRPYFYLFFQIINYLLWPDPLFPLMERHAPEIKTSIKGPDDLVLPALD
jgi:hypothetical protein